MSNYETLMLVRTEITNDELSTLERQLDKMIDNKKGRITLFDRWGKYKLAYPVKKNMYGIYILTRYKVAPEEVQSLFQEIDMLFKMKYNELVLRHVTKKISEDASTVYKFPESIGSNGTSSLDSFIKENKMEGLIETPVEKKAEQTPEQQEEPAEEVPATPESETAEG